MEREWYILTLAQMAAGLLMMLAVKNQNTPILVRSLSFAQNEEAAAANSVILRCACV